MEKGAGQRLGPSIAAISNPHLVNPPRIHKALLSIKSRFWIFILLVETHRMFIIFLLLDIYR